MEGRRWKSESGKARGSGKQGLYALPEGERGSGESRKSLWGWLRGSKEVGRSRQSGFEVTTKRVATEPQMRGKRSSWDRDDDVRGIGRVRGWSRSETHLALDGGQERWVPPTEEPAAQLEPSQNVQDGADDADDEASLPDDAHTAYAWLSKEQELQITGPLRIANGAPSPAEKDIEEEAAFPYDVQTAYAWLDARRERSGSLEAEHGSLSSSLNADDIAKCNEDLDEGLPVDAQTAEAWLSALPEPETSAMTRHNEPILSATEAALDDDDDTPSVLSSPEVFLEDDDEAPSVHSSAHTDTILTTTHAPFYTHHMPNISHSLLVNDSSSAIDPTNQRYSPPPHQPLRGYPYPISLQGYISNLHLDVLSNASSSRGSLAGRAEPQHLSTLSPPSRQGRGSPWSSRSRLASVGDLAVVLENDGEMLPDEVPTSTEGSSEQLPGLEGTRNTVVQMMLGVEYHHQPLLNPVTALDTRSRFEDLCVDIAAARTRISIHCAAQSRLFPLLTIAEQYVRLGSLQCIVPSSQQRQSVRKDAYHRQLLVLCAASFVRNELTETQAMNFPALKRLELNGPVSWLPSSSVTSNTLDPSLQIRTMLTLPTLKRGMRNWADHYSLSSASHVGSEASDGGYASNTSAESHSSYGYKCRQSSVERTDQMEWDSEMDAMSSDIEQGLDRTSRAGLRGREECNSLSTAPTTPEVAVLDVGDAYIEPVGLAATPGGFISDDDEMLENRLDSPFGRADTPGGWISDDYDMHMIADPEDDTAKESERVDSVVGDSSPLYAAELDYVGDEVLLRVIAKVWGGQSDKRRGKSLQSQRPASTKRRRVYC